MIPPPDNLDPLPEEAPSLFGRIGEQVVNAPFNIAQDISNISSGLGVTNKENVNLPFNIPDPKSKTEGLVDLGAFLGRAFVPFTAGAKAGQLASKITEAGPMLSKMLASGSAFSAGGLTESPQRATVEGGLGAGFGAIEGMLPGPLRIAAAGGLGLASGTEAKIEGATDTQAMTRGLVNSILPLISGRRAPNKITEALTENRPVPLLEYGQRNLLEDVQTARTIPGTNEAIPYGGQLEESTTRARPIFGTEQSTTTAEGAVWPERFFKQEDKLPIRGETGEVLPPLLPKRSIPFEGSLIREPIYSEGEATSIARSQQPERSYAIVNGKRVYPEEIATLQSETAPTSTTSATTKDRLLLSSMLSKENESMVKKAAEKLGVQHQGYNTGTVEEMGKWANSMEFYIPENNANVTLPAGSTYKDLKNAVQAKRKISFETESQGTKAPDKEIATLQKTESAPLALETVELPHELKTGDKAVTFIDGERVVGSVHPSVEPGTVRFVEKNGTEHDIRPADIKPLGFRTKAGNVEQVGGMSEIEKARFASEPGTQGLPISGGKMKLSNFGEHGFVEPEVIKMLGKYVAAPVIGGAVGYAEDDQHRLGSAVAGAIAGGLAGHFGTKIFRLLAEGHPQVKVNGSFAEKLSQIGRATSQDAVEMAKAFTANPKMAAKAASQWGLSSGFDRLSRWFEKNLTVNPTVARFLDRAHGEVSVLSDSMRKAVKDLSQMEGIERYNEVLGKYFEGTISHGALVSQVPVEIANLAAVAAQSRTALQRMVWNGMGPGKLANAVQESLGKYLTTSYKIFNDAKYRPTDSQVEAAARSLSDDWGNLETRMDLLHEYLHEIKSNRGIYFGGKGSGAKLDSVLTRSRDLTPEFKAMLGEYSSPIERMAFTGSKLVRAARSAEFFNEVARGTKENGLKYAYSTAEREAEIATLQSISRLAHTSTERELASAKLDELKSYVINSEGASSGRLGHKWLDRRMRDQIATYESGSELYRSAWSRQMINATNIIKYNQVILSPLQFTRQVMSMPIMGMMAKTNPLDWAKAGQTLFDKSAKGAAEILRLKKLGVLQGDPVSGMLREDMAHLMDGTLDSILGGRVKDALHKWEDIWRTPDLVVRVSAFQKEEARLLELYGEAGSQKATREAIDYMNRYTMNYSVAPPGIKLARQLPFINQYLNFAYEALRIAKNLGQDAMKGDLHAIGALATVATAPFIIQQLSEQQLSPEDRKEWEKVKNLGRDYERHNFRFVVGKTANGDFRYISFSPLVPHEPWLQSFRAIMSGDTGALSAVNPVFGWENTPLLNVASTLVTGRNRFSGQKLYTGADYANSIRNDVAPLLLGNDLDRIKRALTPNDQGGLGVIDQRTGKVSSIEDIIQTYASSMRPYTVRPAYLLFQAKQEVTDRIKAQQSSYKAVLATNASVEEKARAKDNFDRAMTHILLSFKEKYGVDLNQAEEDSQ